MAAAAFTPEIMTKIKSVTAMNYKDQAIWYLNAFWNDANSSEKEAETVWDLVIAFSKEDHIKGKEGCELNAVQAFNVLQKRNQTLTALELKKQLRTVDIDANGEMALAEYLLFINSRDPIAFVTNPQGDVDPEVLRAVEAKMQELSDMFDKLTVQLAAEEEAERLSKAAEAAAIDEEAKAKAAEQVALDEEAKAKAAEQVALDEEAKAKAAEQVALNEEAIAKAAEAEAIAKEEVAQAATDKLKKVEDELRAIEDEARTIEMEIKAQEQAKIDEMARLDALTTDQTVGIVKRNMAVQQLAQLKNEDSLPLQKAKITQEAVVRRLKKASDAAAEQTAIAKVSSDEATASRNVASDAAAKAAQKRAEAVAARELAEAKRALAVAARELAEAKRAEAVAARELAEAKRAQAVEAREAAEAAKAATQVQIAECEQALKETEVELQKLKESSGVPKGLIWFQERTLLDKKRSLPTRMW